MSDRRLKRYVIIVIMGGNSLLYRVTPGGYPGNLRVPAFAS